MDAPLIDALQDPADPSPGVDPAAAGEEGGRGSATRRRRRLLVASLATVGAVVLVGGLLARVDRHDVEVGAAGSDTSGTVATTAPTTSTAVAGPPPAVLAGDTGVVVVGDDGLGGAVVIDLDQRRVVRRILEGSGAGDQPHRFDVIDGTLITGWGEIWGTDLETAGGHKITDGTIYIPGTDGAIWIADWAEGRIGAGTMTYEKVRVDGQVVERVVEPKAFPPRDARGFPYFFPSWGLGPYLLHDSDHGIAAWDPTTDAIAWRVGADAGSGRVLDARAGRALWTTDDSTLRVVDEHGNDTVIPIVLPPDERISSARLSPDAARVAVAFQRRSGVGETTTTLAIADPVTGSVDEVDGDLVTPEFATGPVQWSPDGTQVFAIGWSYMAGTTTVARYVAGHDSWTWETLPFGGVTASALIDRGGAAAWLSAADSSAADCVPLTSYAPGRTQVPCAFSF